MMEIPFNTVFENQNKKLIPVTQRKAIIQAVNPGSSSVDIYFLENPQSILKAVKVSSSISVQSSSVGNLCVVSIFDETNPNDMYVTAVLGAATGLNATLTVITGISIDFVGKTFSTTTKTLTIQNGQIITIV